MIPGSSILTSVLGYLYTECCPKGQWISKSHEDAYNFLRTHKDRVWREEIAERAAANRRAA